MTSTQDVRLTLGDRIAFADPRRSWVLVDVEAPKPMLVNLDRPEMRPTILDHAAGVHKVKLSETDSAVLFSEASGWSMELADGNTKLLHDGSVIQCGGDRFRLVLPQACGLTATDICSALLRVEDARLELVVSGDEERAEPKFAFEHTELELPARAHHYLLAYLARRRIQDVRRGVCDEEFAGWVENHELCRELDIATQEQLGVHVHRIRRDAGKFGIDNPKALIDRGRRGALRIGIASSRLKVLSELGKACDDS